MKRSVVILLFTVLFVEIYPQTKQIADLQRQQRILEEDIQNTNKIYLDVRKQTATILERINLINKQIVSRKQMISLQSAEINALEKEQHLLSRDIERLDKELQVAKEKYARAISRMQMNRMNGNELFFLFSGKSLGELLRRLQYLRNYSEWQKDEAERIKTKNEELKTKKTLLEKTQTDKQKALASLQSEEKKLKEEENIRQAEAAEARGQQKELQKQLQNKRQEVQKLNAQIEKLIAEEVARQEREAEARRRALEADRKRRADEAAAKAARETAKETTPEKGKEEEIAASKSEAKAPEPKIGTAEASSEAFNLSKNFAANKGKLPMPVTGAATIVSQFGVNRHSEWNISTNSNGIDIQAQKGAAIRSVFDGEVSKIFSFPGSNTCVIIRHGDYYTFYANIFDLYVKQGDKVKTGQSIGSIYTDPDTGLSKMHFQLWQKTNKINPAPWLKR